MHFNTSNIFFILTKRKPLESSILVSGSFWMASFWKKEHMGISSSPSDPRSIRVGHEWRTLTVDGMSF